jgi:hypothetical protein
LSPLYLILAVSLIGYSGVIAARVLLSLYALELGAVREIGLLRPRTLHCRWCCPGRSACGPPHRLRGLLMGGLITGVIGMAICGSRPMRRCTQALSGAAFVFATCWRRTSSALSTPDERARNFSNASLMGSLKRARPLTPD